MGVLLRLGLEGPTEDGPDLVVVRLVEHCGSHICRGGQTCRGKKNLLGGPQTVIPAGGSQVSTRDIVQLGRPQLLEGRTRVL